MSFVAGLFVGATLGVLLMGLLCAAKRGDEMVGGQVGGPARHSDVPGGNQKAEVRSGPSTIGGLA